MKPILQFLATIPAPPRPSQPFAAFGITSGPGSRRIRRLRASHPPLDERLAAPRALSAS